MKHLLTGSITHLNVCSAAGEAEQLEWQDKKVLMDDLTLVWLLGSEQTVWLGRRAFSRHPCLTALTTLFTCAPLSRTATPFSFCQLVNMSITKHQQASLAVISKLDYRNSLRERSGHCLRSQNLARSLSTSSKCDSTSLFIVSSLEL